MKKLLNGKSLKDFGTTGKATITKEIIIQEGLEEEFVQLINEFFPKGISATRLQDLLSLDAEWIYRCLGI